MGPLVSEITLVTQLVIFGHSSGFTYHPYNDLGAHLVNIPSCTEFGENVSAASFRSIFTQQIFGMETHCWMRYFYEFRGEQKIPPIFEQEFNMENYDDEDDEGEDDERSRGEKDK